MIAVSISDLTAEDDARKRIADIKDLQYLYTVPDSICIRNDSLSEGPFVSMAKLVQKDWKKKIVLESDNPDIILKAIESMDDGFVMIKGANRDNLERYAEIAGDYDLDLCICEEDPQVLIDLAMKARDMGV